MLCVVAGVVCVCVFVGVWVCVCVCVCVLVCGWVLVCVLCVWVCVCVWVCWRGIAAFSVQLFDRAPLLLLLSVQVRRH